MFMIDPYKIFWCRFTDYYKHCDNMALRGATYHFVWNNKQPENYEHPSEFEGCVYVGLSADSYVERNGARFKPRGHLHKRMTSHHKPLTTGILPKGEEEKYKLFIDSYGYGDDVLNGVNREIVLWLCLLIPAPNVPDELIRTWVFNQESQSILKYAMKWGYTPLMNIDRKSNNHRKEDSFSERIRNGNHLKELPFIDVA
jgi:hypothetical protein